MSGNFILIGFNEKNNDMNTTNKKTKNYHT